MLAEKKPPSPLALIPLGVALALGPLMLPRAIAPSTVPVPVADMRAFDAVVASDRARAKRVEAERLPDDGRVLGQAIRDFNRASATEDKSADTSKLRHELDAALATVRALPNGNAIVLDLRAFQLEHFLVEVRGYETTGQSSNELDELGGAFVWRSKLAGWIDGRTVLIDEPTLRVMFKLVFNVATQLEGLPDFEPTVDELRVLYTFYLQHPHAPEKVRAQLDQHRKTAHTEKECKVIDASERLAAETWRLEKIEKLEKIDPAYPVAYARGVELYRMEKYGESARAFETWLDAHPDGPFTLRAHGYLRAAIRAKQQEL